MATCLLKRKFNISIKPERNNLLSHFGKSILQDRYLVEGEDFQDLFARVSSYYADDQEHAQRIYDYISQLWFIPATPVLSNGGTTRGMPISCFLNEVEDSLEDIVDTWSENVFLASKGGGIGTYWGKVRSINEAIKSNGSTSGVIPFIKVQDSLTLAISQGSLRRGSTAVYLPIWHPEITEFVDLRRPTGGDINRRSLNIHHGVVISDNFMRAVEDNAKWQLRSPADNQVVEELDARDLWVRLLSARIETGEPYILFIDRVNAAIPEHHKKSKLFVKTSNLCSEITLPTGRDHLGKKRTAVCCLSSLNLEKFDDWQEDKQFILDVMRFLDNVLQDFIDTAPATMANAIYAAARERSIGLGVMGFSSFLQSKNVPIESVMSGVWNHKIFKHIKTYVDQASKILCHEKGPCPDAEEHGIQQRFSNTTAIAPTAAISIIAGNTSPGIDPFTANNFTQKTLSGSFVVKNKNLLKLLEEKSMNQDSVWSSIATREGSVQHLDFLSEHEKKVFKTAYEIDQTRLIKLAAERNTYISQAQSLNLFFYANTSKQYVHDVHYQAWQQGLKSLYYCRSTSIQRAEKVSHQATYKKVTSEQNLEDECLSCQ
jgi:ribonucleoside-diphosphate reductase alpha chain